MQGGERRLVGDAVAREAELRRPQRLGVADVQPVDQPVAEVAPADADAVDGGERQPLVVVADHREEVAGAVLRVDPGVEHDEQALVGQQQVVEQALPGVRAVGKRVAEVVVGLEHRATVTARKRRVGPLSPPRRTEFPRWGRGASRAPT